VTGAATVPEGLALIAAEKYEILILDLNIGQPGDGFTVVSAMRRTQPEAITIILTGYPAFESALRAIREQVDDFITKPADMEELLTNLRQRSRQGMYLIVAPVVGGHHVVRATP
jgi:YesN/AraC family two-component response regulator